MRTMRAGSRRRGPSLLLSVGVLVLFLAAAGGIGAVGTWQASRTYRSFDRLDGREPTVVALGSTGPHHVWALHHDYAGPPEASVTVTRDGETVPGEADPQDLTYETGSTMATTVWTFDVQEPGDHVITATGIDTTTQFLVGPGDPGAERERATRLAVWVGAAGVGVYLALMVVIARRDRRDRPRPAP